ncbi:MAG: hypothetical protein QME46_07965 [Thermoanaerobacteraceae bacterium]|nr:hypothetical protein [Thermoanaerobacteraceae bacterium]
MVFIKAAFRVIVLFAIVCAVAGLIGFVYHLISSAPLIYAIYMTYLIVSMILMIFGVFTMFRGYHPGRMSENMEIDFNPKWGARNPVRMIIVGTVVMIIGLGLFFAGLYIESLLH